MAGFMVPATSRSVLQIVADFCAWNLAFDDEILDENALSAGKLSEILAQIQRAIEVPESPLYCSDKYASALRDIRLRLDLCGTRSQVQWWVETMRIWFMTEPWRAGNQDQQIVLSLNQYSLMRLRSGGAFSFLAMGRFGRTPEPSPEDLALRPVQALTEIAVTLCTWSADIIGHIKDHRDEDGNNLIDVLRHGREISLDAAVFEAVNLWNRIMAHYLRLRSDIVRNAREGLLLYLEDLDHFIRSGIDWVEESSRYSRRGVNSSELSVVADMVVENIDPIPIPNFQWWWDYGRQA
jgi:terpene synthase-like protein